MMMYINYEILCKGLTHFSYPITVKTLFFYYFKKLIFLHVSSLFEIKFFSFQSFLKT